MTNTDFVSGPKPRKSSNGLNNLKPWSATLQMHMWLQMSGTISVQNARLIRRVLAPDFVADAIKNQRNGQQQTIYRIVKEDL